MSDDLAEDQFVVHRWWLLFIVSENIQHGNVIREGEGLHSISNNLLYGFQYCRFKDNQKNDAYFLSLDW